MRCSNGGLAIGAAPTARVSARHRRHSFAGWMRTCNSPVAPVVRPSGVRFARRNVLEQKAIQVGHHTCTTGIATGRSNVSLQLTGDSMKEVVVAARLAPHVSNLHLP